MMGILKSFRTWGLYLAPLAVIMWLWHIDPDNGLSTHDMLLGLTVAGLGVTCAHVVRKILFDYIKLENIVQRAVYGNNTGAGLVFLGVCLVFVALILTFAPRAHAQDVRTFVPTGAAIYGPVLKAEQVRLWSGHAEPSMLAALVEQESCVTLHSARCWNPAARLKTSREEGAGMGQITRAYRPDGSLRFDSLDAVKSLDPSLSAWSWSNVYQRPDLQLRAIVAMNRDCARRIAPMVHDQRTALDMCDAAYNGGYAGMQAERRACGLRAGCDPQRWFVHVENVCLKSKTKNPGYGASACDINREHVRMVSQVRRPKYEPLMGAA